MAIDRGTPAEYSRSSPLRIAYAAAFVAARCWWFVRRPHTTGSMVALWHDGRLLLVRTSYRRPCTLPGGFMNRGEGSRAAAVRELFEEVNVAIAPSALALAWHGTLGFEHRVDTVTIWEAVLDARPLIQIDGIELVWAGWKTPDEARAMPLLRHIEPYLASRR
jgi:ADP-ribose pyrophosphatase YjhB (NUDIX family)